MTREWFTTYCQNAAANVLDKDGEIRFNYSELKAALDTVAEHKATGIPSAILKLHNNIDKLCDTRNGVQQLSESEEYALLLTLLNIHAAYLMVSGLWKEEPKLKPEGGVDKYGFEIF